MHTVGFECSECFYFKIKAVTFFLASVTCYTFQRIRVFHSIWMQKLNSSPFLSYRFSFEWHSDRTCNTIGARNCLQRGHQLWSLQDYLSDLQLWKQGHILLCPCCGTVFIPHPQARSGQTASSHFRDSLSNEQRPTTKVCTVFDHSAPHRSFANCSKISRWNSVPEFRNQPSSWWV